MKAHTLFLSLSAGVLLSAMPRLQADPKSFIEDQAHLMTHIDACNVEGFKKNFERLQKKYPEKQGTLIVDVAEYTRAVRNQQAAQLASNVGKSRVIAGVKAGLLTVSASKYLLNCLGMAQKTKNYVSLPNDDKSLLRSPWPSLFSNKVWSISEIALILAPVSLYFASNWAYQNGHFAYYGNRILIQDIQKLDGILKYLEEADAALCTQVSEIQSV